MLSVRTPDPVVFAALADPTRLFLVEQLTDVPSRSTTQLVAGTGLSRQAVRKHLGVLAEAGLVRHHREGRTRLWQLDALPLRDVSEWAASYRRHWEQRLDRLEHYLDTTQGAIDESTP
ncbi:MAG: helix-turn-helix transcriptional regulator [Alphaproteobacteria bacterium]|nr:helix-turn-helix transcriptional regulator [Alphaproteobacteria bacterium]